LPLEPGFALPPLPAEPPLFVVVLALPAVEVAPADPLLESEPLAPGEDPALPVASAHAHFLIKREE
jgi:hypothetical protein